MAMWIATTVSGLEEVAAGELESGFGLTVEAAADGALLFDAPEAPSAGAAALARILNYWGRAIHRLGPFLAEGPVSSLDDCYELARALDYRPLIGPEESFAVRPRRSGSHSFGSPDVGRVVGQAVIDAFRSATGTRLRVSLDDPDVIVRVEVIDDACRLWVDATGDVPLYRRGYRRRLHPASLRPSLAFLLLRLAGWDGGPLLDPMAGIGTIPIESALWAMGIAPGGFRADDPACERWGWIAGFEPGASWREAAALRPPADLELATAYREPLLATSEPLDILGVERFAKHVQSAWMNVVAARVSDWVRIVQGDATRLQAVIGEPARYPVAVVNPPFGRRVGSTSMVHDLYTGFAAAAAGCGVRKIVALAESRRLMTGALEGAGYQVTKELPVLIGELRAHVLIGEREDRA